MDYDVIVIGSGGAGSAAAHAASNAGASVLVVAKDPIGCSDSKIAEGIVTVRAVAEDSDSHEMLADNLRLAGGDLPTPEITQAFAQDSEEAYDWLRRQGVRPRINSNRGAPRALPIPLGGHTHRRSVGHDNGGLSIGHAAWNAIVQGFGIDYLDRLTLFPKPSPSFSSWTPDLSIVYVLRLGSYKLPFLHFFPMRNLPTAKP